MARTPSGGGGAASVAGLAAIAVAERSGRVASSRSVPATGRRRRRTARTATRAAARGRRSGAGVSDCRQWHHPFGVAAPAQEMALIARRHMDVFGTTRRALRHAGGGAALPREPQSRRDHARRRSRSTTGAASRPIADPIRLVDCSLENDGATAVLVTTVERARDLAQPPVPRARAGDGRRADPHRARRLLPHVARASASATMPAATSRGSCSRAPGSRRPTSTSRMIVEPFTMAVPLSLEQYGFCGMRRGRSVDRVGRDALARRRPAGEHARRLERRGVHPRREPPPRSGAPAPRDVDDPGRRAPRSRSSPARSATRRARCCSGRDH